MTDHEILDHEGWVAARKRLLEAEKEFTRLRDKVTRERQALPWERVEEDYRFDSDKGTESLADLFDDKSQLIIYHFMFGPDWTEGCKSCSFIADHFDPAVVHLAQRDVSLVAVSSAAPEVLSAFRKRMGWRFRWVSSGNSNFNRDFQVTFTPEEIERGDATYNYKAQGFPSTEAPGASVFYKDGDGEIYHTYSVYQRGLDMFITAYHWLDIVPKGRDEADLGYTMQWLRLHDAYGT